MQEKFEIKDGVLVKYNLAEEEAVVPLGVIAIGRNAFALTYGLKRVILPENLEEIGDSAFYGCPELQEVNLPKSLKKIGKSAFYCCNLAEVSVPEGIERIEEYAFGECRNMQKTTLPSTLKSIGKGAFEKNLSLIRVFIPKSVTHIDEDAFARCNPRLEIYFEGELPKGLTEKTEIRKVSHVATDYGSPRNFHTSSGSFDTYAYETDEEVRVSWNPNNAAVHTNVPYGEFEKL